MIRICPSTNPCDEEKLVDYAKEMQAYDIRFMHCDVMDGVFVENKCLSVEKIREITEETQIGLDIHLMVSEPLMVLDKFLELPANFITMHYEAFKNSSDILRAVDKIHKKGVLAGISIKPNTNISAIKPLLPYIDLVLIMSVEPGKSGQEFIESSIGKIKEIYSLIVQNQLRVKIEVDGGINKDNIRGVVNAGASMVVIGSALYNSEDRKNFVEYVQRI